MSDKADRIQLKCSNCGRVVARVPKDYQLEDGLVCPGCGAKVQPPSVIDKLAGELKGALGNVAGRRENEPDERAGRDQDQGAEDQTDGNGGEKKR